MAGMAAAGAGCLAGSDESQNLDFSDDNRLGIPFFLSHAPQ
jgi:hypothetical protein